MNKLYIFRGRELEKRREGETKAENQIQEKRKNVGARKTGQNEAGKR